MGHLPSSSWVNTSEGPCWLLHAVTWEWGSTVVLTRWIWTPQRQTCHSANHSICLETQYGRLGCVLEKTPGEPPLASQLSLVALSLLFFFHSKTKLCMERVRKEMGFHGCFRAVIRLSVFSETIQLFDAVIVCRMIYDFKLHNLFMLLFFFKAFSEWVWLHDSFLKNTCMNKFLTTMVFIHWQSYKSIYLSIERF